MDWSVSITTKIGRVVGLLAAASLVGCGADQAADSPQPGMASGVAPVEDVGPEGLSPGAKHEIVAEVDVGYGKIMFHRLETADGKTSIATSESVPNTYTATPFSRLLGSSRVTHLELFKALQPGATPPAILKGMHAVEAAGLGRNSADELAITFDKDGPIEKSAASCEAWVYQDPPDNCGVRTWTNGRIADDLSGNLGLHVGQYWAYSTTKPVTLGICNESDATIYGRIGIDYGGDSSSSYTYWGWATLPTGYMWRWWDFREVTTCGSCSGDVCTIIYGCYNPSRYRVDGSSAAGKLYRLRTAEAYQPNCYYL